MDGTSGDRRDGDRRAKVPEGTPIGDEAIRPITSPSALEHARRLLEQGVGGIEEGPDGRLWAKGLDRRRRDRRRNPEDG